MILTKVVENVVGLLYLVPCRQVEENLATNLALNDRGMSSAFLLWPKKPNLNCTTWDFKKTAFNNIGINMKTALFLKKADFQLCKKDLLSPSPPKTQTMPNDLSPTWIWRKRFQSRRPVIKVKSHEWALALALSSTKADNADNTSNWHTLFWHSTFIWMVDRLCPMSISCLVGTSVEIGLPKGHIATDSNILTKHVTLELFAANGLKSILANLTISPKLCNHLLAKKHDLQFNNDLLLDRCGSLIAPVHPTWPKEQLIHVPPLTLLPAGLHRQVLQHHGHQKQPPPSKAQQKMHHTICHWHCTCKSRSATPAFAEAHHDEKLWDKPQHRGHGSEWHGGPNCPNRAISQSQKLLEESDMLPSPLRMGLHDRRQVPCQHGEGELLPHVQLGMDHLEVVNFHRQGSPSSAWKAHSKLLKCLPNPTCPPARWHSPWYCQKSPGVAVPACGGSWRRKGWVE